MTGTLGALSEPITHLLDAQCARHYSRRTERANCLWVRRYVRFYGLRLPAEMAEAESNAFVIDLAVADHVSASAQTQALSALLFLYRHVRDREVGELADLTRARKPRRLLVVLTREEGRALLDNLDGESRLIASLLHGAGLRLSEGLRLRVHDLDLDGGRLVVRDGKGGKDRLTMLPRALEPALREQLPDLLARKYPSAPAEWRRQWVFPQQRRCIDRRLVTPLRQKGFAASAALLRLSNPSWAEEVEDANERGRPGAMSLQAYLDNIEAKTGKTPNELIAMAAERGFDDPATKAEEIVSWLKADYGLGRGHAMAQVHVIRHGAQISDKHVGSGGTHVDPSSTLRLDGVKKDDRSE